MSNICEIHIFEYIHFTPEFLGLLFAIIVYLFPWIAFISAMITSSLDFYLVCFQLLGSFCSVDFLSNRDYLISTQATVTGGFSKWPGHSPGMTFIFL